MSFKKGDSVGVLYGQKNEAGKWTVGIHNGVYLKKGTSRYHIKHASNTKNPCDLESNTRTVYFYYNRDAYLNDYNRIKNGTLKGTRLSDIYLLNQIYKTQGTNPDINKNPAIAFALEKLDSNNRHVVHNGRFVRFEEKNDKGITIRNIEDYQIFRQKYPSCKSIQNARGELIYAHYNIRKTSSPGRYEPFLQIPDGVRILNIKNMSK